MIDFITTNWIISLWTVLLVIVFFVHWMDERRLRKMEEEIKAEHAKIKKSGASYLSAQLVEVQGKNGRLEREIKELKEEIEKLKEDNEKLKEDK